MRCSRKRWSGSESGERSGRRRSERRIEGFIEAREEEGEVIGPGEGGVGIWEMCRLAGRSHLGRSRMVCLLGKDSD